MSKVRQLFKSNKFLFLFSMILALISIAIFKGSNYFPDNQLELIILPILSLILGPFSILGFVFVEFSYLTIFHPENILYNLLFVVSLFISNFLFWKLWYSFMNKHGYYIPNLNSLYNFIKLLIAFALYSASTYLLYVAFNNIGLNPINLDATLIFSTLFIFYVILFSIYDANYFNIPIYTPKRQFKEVLPRKFYSFLFIMFFVFSLLNLFISETIYNHIFSPIAFLSITIYLFKPYNEDVFKIQETIKINLFSKVIISIFIIMLLIILIADIPLLFLLEGEVDLVILLLFSDSSILLGILLIPILIYMYFLEKKVTNPINKLSETLSANISSRAEYMEMENNLKLINIGNEIKILVDSLLGMEKKLVKYGENLVQLTSENEKVETELRFAREIQTSMIPNDFEKFYSDFNDGHDYFELWGLMRAAREVGGDFYDYFKIDNDNIGFVIGDVSGKGVTASLIMVKAMTLIQNHAKNFDDLSKVFYEVNNLLCEDNVENLFVTCWIGKLNIRTGEISFVNAGHNPPLIRLDNNDFEYLNMEPDVPLAVLEDMSFESHSIQLNNEGSIFLYTDGVTEANEDYKQFYGEDRLKEILNKHKNDSLSNIISSIDEDIKDFSNHGEQFDDTTMFIVKFK